ncbi:site-specific integrase [Brevibacillus parabrevis]
MPSNVVVLKEYMNDPKIDEFVFNLDVGFVERAVSKNKIDNKHPLIMLVNKRTGLSVVHPLTAFVFSRWKYQKYNTQRLQAIHLIQFLNHVLISHRHEYKLFSLADLNFEHGNKFLNYQLATGLTRKSVKNIERTLVRFYEFLAKKECTKHFTINDLTEAPLYSTPSRSFTISPFHPEYSFSDSDSQRAIQHELKLKYLFPFLRTAIRVARPVAFGIYLSIFGGLRAGEIVNIRHRDVTPYNDEWGSGGLKINLASRALRTNIKDSSGTSQVKKPRKQFVFNVKDALPILYEEHMKYLSKYYGDKTPPISHALFINRDGKPLTGKSLRYYFGVVKEAFLRELESSDNPDDVVEALNLRTTKWSFHIGRGIFTNLIGKLAKNPYELALARGDMSIFSALTYMADTDDMKKEIERLINDVFNSNS